MYLLYYMAGVEGLEPSQAVLETDVLPLTLYPYMKLFTTINIITYKFKIDNRFFEKIHKNS